MRTPGAGIARPRSRAGRHSHQSVAAVPQCQDRPTRNSWRHLSGRTATGGRAAARRPCVAADAPRAASRAAEVTADTVSAGRAVAQRTTAAARATAGRDGCHRRRRGRHRQHTQRQSRQRRCQRQITRHEHCSSEWRSPEPAACGPPIRDRELSRPPPRAATVAARRTGIFDDQCRQPHTSRRGTGAGGSSFRNDQRGRYSPTNARTGRAVNRGLPPSSSSTITVTACEQQGQLPWQPCASSQQGRGGDAGPAALRQQVRSNA